jgi:hypothetical protein
MAARSGTHRAEPFNVTRRKRVVIAALIATGTIVPLGILTAARIPFSSDRLRVRLIDTLEDRLNVDADLDSLTLRFHPSLRAIGRGLVLRTRGRSDIPPLIEVKTFVVDANLSGLWRRTVSFVKLEGLRIQIPPDDGNEEPGDTPDSPPPPPGSALPADYLKQVVISDLDAPDAVLTVLRRDPTKPPRTWSLHRLHVKQVSFSTTMPFETVLTNALPPGEIQASGTFGPWHAFDPGATPLGGAFVFNDADLSVFDGIGGTLSAAGSFRGTLDRIDITGRTQTPDFVVNTGRHRVALATSYHAIVDATNGNTTLDPVDATFLNTSVNARGGVYEEPGVNGRVIRLNLVIDRGRLEDIMRLAVPSPRPPMSGAMRLNTKFVIPPGKRDIVDKLQLDGTFSIANGRFTDAGVQTKINELSKRASARTEETAIRAVGSNFEGRFQLGSSRLALPAVSFDVPGALVQLRGEYGMRHEDIDFAGNLYMDAKISQTVTGFKSLLLKVVDPFFRRNGKTVVPLKISGSRSDPKFGVDFGRALRRASN